MGLVVKMAETRIFGHNFQTLHWILMKLGQMFQNMVSYNLSICLENVELIFVWQFLFLNQVCVLKIDKVSLICDNFFAILGFLKQYVPNPLLNFYEI